MLAETVIDLFTRSGAAFLTRWAHVLVGITWIGLLYFFNLVQVPAFAAMEPAVRNNAMDKLTWRALWWFRWAAAATFGFGLLLLLLIKMPNGDPELVSTDYWKSYQGVSIATGILLGTTMFLNVWGIIWRKQKIVIGNARNVQGGGEADPDAPAAGRRALMASRQNVIFSIPMLIFMIGTAHFPYKVLSILPAQNRAIYWLITLVLFALFELNATGVIGGTAPGGINAMYDTHQNALWTAFIYGAVSLALYMFVLTT